eukprot:8819622-Alexandrium_andersonii.AAC.1
MPPPPTDSRWQPLTATDGHRQPQAVGSAGLMVFNVLVFLARVPEDAGGVYKKATRRKARH